MSVVMNVDYSGELRCHAHHEPSGGRIETDAPTDNAGKGEAFSPTDLVAAALATCAITTMAIKAAREDIWFGRASARVEKHMSSEGPRRIERMVLRIDFADDYAPAHRSRLEDIAKTCPVALTLSANTEVVYEFMYPSLTMGA